MCKACWHFSSQTKSNNRRSLLVISNRYIQATRGSRKTVKTKEIMFCHNVGSQWQFTHLLMALTKEERQTWQGYRQSCTLQYQREMLTEETSYWWGTWTHGRQYAAPWKRTDALSFRAPLHKKRQILKRSKLMFCMYETVGKWPTYLLPEASQTGCLMATLSRCKAQHFSRCAAFVCTLLHIFPMAKYCIYCKHTTGDPDTDNSLSGMSARAAVPQCFPFLLEVTLWPNQKAHGQ